MHISIEWIKEFVNLPELDPKELAERFTLGTAEVEGFEVIGEAFKKIKIAEIVEIEKHPEADKLNLVTFNYGGPDNKRVVCGASNVRIGLKTPYAPIGLTLPNGMTLEPKKIRGVLSEGMLCSEEELGLKDTSEGILELPADSKIGMSFLEYQNESTDLLIEIDNKSLTHRPDLWGHYGLAREFATLFEKELSNPFDRKWESEQESFFTNDKAPMGVSVDTDSACLGYFGLSMDGVSVTESPMWMKKRLLAVGLRPINNIVDISNYVMWELGMPLHIFDRDQIKDSKVSIKKLSAPATFKTLDEIDRELVAGDTVICDGDTPLVIGGIMGGLASGVTDNTKSIFIEVANWKASMVRATSTRLGLRTDSSSRYEKSLDSKLMYRTLLRTMELVCKLCPEAKVIGAPDYDGVNLDEIKPLFLKSSFSKIRKTLGHEVSNEKIESIFSRLDFKTSVSGDDVAVEVPTYRCTKDIDCEADLIEEIGRVVGYDHIAPVSPMLDVAPVKLTPAQKLHRKVNEYFALQANAFEVMTYPLVGKSLLDKASMNTDCPVLLNALSKDHDRMRSSIVPNFLEALSKNSKNYSSGKIFEIGRVYPKNDKTFASDETYICFASFSHSENIFLKTVDLAEGMLSYCDIPYDLSPSHPKFKNQVIDESWMGMHPFEFYNVRIMGKMNGAIFSVHPLMLKKFKIKGHVTFFVVNSSSFEAKKLKEKTKYTPLNKFPTSEFDYTLDLTADESVEAILGALKKLKDKEIVGHKIVDVFYADNSRKFVTYRSYFSSSEKTLDGKKIKELETSVLAILDKNGYSLKS